MHLRNVAVVLTLLCSACGGSWRTREANDTSADEHTLPLTRLRLYASGVGYFQRRGLLHGTGDSLPVPASHLDDALKSLVLLSPAGELGSVTFPSRLSPAVARARAGLPAEEDAALSFDRLLASLRGEEVEIAAHGKVLRGRIVEVLAVGPSHPTYVHTRGPQKSGEEPADEPEVLQVLLLTEAGELKRLLAQELNAVKPLNPLVVQRLEAAMAARLSLRSNRHQSLALGSHGAKEISLAYLAEAPVWRPSYRLLLDDPKRPDSARLQAWALVHNDTDEAWRGVTVELSNGHPESFLFPLSAPRYDRRELHTPDRELSSVPQLSTTTPDAMWGDFSDYEGESVERVGDVGSIGLGSFGTVGHGTGGGGSGSGYGRSSHGQRDAQFMDSPVLVLGDLSRAGGEEPTPGTAISVFEVPRKLDLPAHHSAMVPFIEGAISTRSMVWFAGFDALPERAIAVRNDTANSLPPGPLAVFADSGFQGEADLDGLKPGERRFARIGRDPELELETLGQLTESEEKRITLDGGNLAIHLVRVSETKLRLSSRSDRPREVYLTLPVVKNAVVEGCDRLDYDRTSSTAFAVYDVQPGVPRTLKLTTKEGLFRHVAVASLSAEELAQLADVRTIPESERGVVRAAIPQALAIAAIHTQQEEAAEELEAVESDVTRLREHLGTLTKGEAGSAQDQLMKRILERDEQLRGLSAKGRALKAELARKEQALQLALKPLALK